MRRRTRRGPVAARITTKIRVLVGASRRNNKIRMLSTNWRAKWSRIAPNSHKIRNRFLPEINRNETTGPSKASRNDRPLPPSPTVCCTSKLCSGEWPYRPSRSTVRSRVLGRHNRRQFKYRRHRANKSKCRWHRPRRKSRCLRLRIKS